MDIFLSLFNLVPWVANFLTKICCCKPWFLLGLQSQHKMSLWVFSYFCMVTLYANHQKKSRATKSLNFGAKIQINLKISSSLRSHCCKMRHFEWFLTSMMMWLGASLPFFFLHTQVQPCIYRGARLKGKKLLARTFDGLLTFESYQGLNNWIK